MIFKKTILGITNCNCGKKEQLLLELSSPLTEDHLQAFVNSSFNENKIYKRTGLFYVEDIHLIAIGPFGSNRLQIKCKTTNCGPSIANLESIIGGI